MKTSPVKGLLMLASLLLFGLPGPNRAVAVGFDEPEDSPLFADSVQKVFVEWASRDSARPGPAAPYQQRQPFVLPALDSEPMRLAGVAQRSGVRTKFFLANP